MIFQVWRLGTLPCRGRQLFVYRRPDRVGCGLGGLNLRLWWDKTGCGFGWFRWEVVSAAGIPWIVRLVTRVPLEPAG